MEKHSPREKEGSPAVGNPGNHSFASPSKASHCGIVGKAKSLESDRPGPIWTPLLTISVILDHFTPLCLSPHLQNGGDNSCL